MYDRFTEGGDFMEYVVKAKQFLLENEVKTDGYLHIKDGVFNGFVNDISENIDVVDWSDYTIAPGLFDTHIHGINSYDVMDGKNVAIHEMSKALMKIGVTRFLPTTLTSSQGDLERAIIAVVHAVEEGLEGAQSEGIFLEGPYFTEKHKGAQNPAHFMDPSVEQLTKWQLLAKGHILKLALAPEREGSFAFIEQLRNDLFISIAHSDATYDRCNEAVQKGANQFVHLFNGMSGLHHRAPGVVGAAFMNEQSFAEIICDGHHVHPDMAVLAARIKGQNLVLISDCMRAGLMPDGEYYLGEFAVTMKDGIARTASGSLAGSTLALIDGVKNLTKWSGLPLHDVWHLASLSPARSVGKDETFGSIAAGKVADFVVLDETLSVVSTTIDGVEKYRRSK